MKHLLLFVIAGISFTSCATIINNSYTVTEINSNPDSALIVIKGNNDTLCCTNTPILLERKNEDVVLEIIKDTLRQEIVLKGKLSAAFIWGNLFSGAGLIGHAIDLASPKRFTYDKEVYVDLYAPEKTYKNWLVRKDDLLNLTFSLPHVNQYYMKTEDSYSNKFGFWGISLGLEYFQNTSSYWSFQMGAATDIFIPFPAPIDYEGEREIFSVVFSNIRFNKKLQKFHLGAGISYQQLQWRRVNFDTIPQVDVRKSNNGLGLSLAGQYNFWKAFYIGTIYQPMIMNLTDQKLDYQHYWTFELIYKLPVKRRENLN